MTSLFTDTKFVNLWDLLGYPEKEQVEEGLLAKNQCVNLNWQGNI